MWCAATITSRTRRSRCCCIEALGAPVPQFAHVPLILGPDKKRLSKRHGATSVMEYARQGYLPEAMVNFLALLGWSPGSGDRELFTRDELVAAFDLDGHQRRQRGVQPREARLVQPAAHRAARARRARAAAEAVRSKRPASGTTRFSATGTPGSSRCSSCSSRARSGSTSSLELGRFFFADALEYDEAAVAKHLRVGGHAPSIWRRSTRRSRRSPTFDAGVDRGGAA